MKKTYLFYDIESSGLNKCFDQVLQFAAIRTDCELKEIERHEILVKLNPDTVISPEAVLVHHLTPSKVESGVCEYEAIQQIHKMFNEQGTVTIGYNTLGFDDEFLRFSFYRNLFAPYTHQYANNCSRMDLYPIAAIYSLFKPEVIKWPKIDGKSTLRLEHLCAENKLADGRAHDAMVDVEATLALARLLYKERQMWDYLLGCFDKKQDLDRLSKLTKAFDDYPLALLVEGIFGADNFYQSAGLGLGMHNHYKNQSLWLRLDLPNLTETTLDNIPETTFVSRKRFGEPPMLLPFIDRFNKHLSDEKCKLIASNIAWLKNNPKILSAIISYHKEYEYPPVSNIDVDAALYQNGFMKDIERMMCDRFHAADIKDKPAMVDKFSNPNLRAQTIRVLGRNYPDLLSAEMKQEFDEYLNNIKKGKTVIDYRENVHYSQDEALGKIKLLQENEDLDPKQITLLKELFNYIDAW